MTNNQEGRKPPYTDQELDELYIRAGQESNFCRSVIHISLKRGDSSKKKLIMKLCKVVSDQTGLTIDDLKNEIYVATLASKIGVGPTVYESNVSQKYAYIIMDMMEYSLKQVIQMVDVASRPTRNYSCHASNSSATPNPLNDFVNCNAQTFVKMLLEKNAFGKIYIMFKTLGEKGYFHMDLHAENVFLNFERQENGEFVVSKVRLIDFGLTLHVPAQTPLEKGIEYPTYDNREVTFHNEFDIFKYSALDILDQLGFSYWGGGGLKRSVVKQFLGPEAQEDQVNEVVQLNQEN